MKTFYVGIKGVIVKGDKVLLLRSNTARERRDMWEMPGGRIDNNETIEQTLKRELVEELPNIKNIEVHEILYSYRLPRDIDGDKSLVLIYYRVSASFDSDPQISDEHIEWQWADKNTALQLTHEPMHTAINRAFGA